MRGPDSPIFRVAVLSVHTCPLATLGGKKSGGMNVYVRELSRELGSLGIAIDVFTRSQDPCVPHVNDTYSGELVRVVHIPAGPERPLSTGEIFPYLSEFVNGIVDFAEYEHITYDLIHSHYWLSGWVGMRLQEIWDIPLINMFHTLGHMKNRVATGRLAREPEMRLATETAIMAQADRLIAATPAEKIQMMWLYRADMHKISVIPPGVDTSHFHPFDRQMARQMINVSEKAKMLLFVGRIEPLKGIDTLLEALAILKQQSPALARDLCVSIIGGEIGREGEEDAEMRRLLVRREQLGLEDLVTFLGARSQESLKYYYAAAEAVVMPSHYESFGMVALEAMACGIPVIASEVGGLAYLVRDGMTGFHVPSQDPEELAGKIRLLFENEELRQEMSIQAVREAQEYAWPKIASQITDVYNSLTTKRQSAL